MKFSSNALFPPFFSGKGGSAYWRHTEKSLHHYDVFDIGWADKDFNSHDENSGYPFRHRALLPRNRGLAHIRIIDAMERGSGTEARQLMIVHLNEADAAVFLLGHCKW